MYDPADIGPLDATRWDEKLNERLSLLIPYDADELLDFMADQSRRERLDYIKDNGERIIIPVTTAPARFTSRQVRPLRKAFETLAEAVAKVAAAWLETPALQTVLPLEPYEAEWLKLAADVPGASAQVFHRWDFALNLAGDPAAENFKLFEVNSVDVGGIHYAGAAHHVSMCELMWLGAPNVWGMPGDSGADPRLILMTALMFHPTLKGLMRKRRVVIAENQDFTTGITEAESIAKFFRKRFIKTECVDARNLETHPEYGVAFRGKPVDAVYRNIELRDLADMESGNNLAGMRAAAKAGKMVSSPFGELDHKSLFEALGSQQFAELFSPDEKRLIAAHVPWTRLLSERTTTDRGGKQIELADYTRRHQSDLVLKPNRSCGGQGVTIGRIVSENTWQQTLAAALQAPSTWVVQDFVPIPRRRTCRLNDEGTLESDEMFTVYGGYTSIGGIGFVGRASHSPVVNVMQGGGILPVMGKMPKR